MGKVEEKFAGKTCVISPFAGGCCEACASPLGTRAWGLPVALPHVVREVLVDKYGGKSVPHLFCAEHCPSCAKVVKHV